MANRFVVCAGYADHVKNKPRNVGQQVANPLGSRRYRNRDVALHRDVAWQLTAPVSCLEKSLTLLSGCSGVLGGCSSRNRNYYTPGVLPRRQTVKLQHEDQLRLELHDSAI